MFASLLAKTSQGISYPYLYLNSAASPRALVTHALASAMEPVRTQPTDGEILKICETDEGSMSLSYSYHIISLVRWSRPVNHHTGTFFCESTTAQSLPLTPMDMIFAAVMALKAYSRQRTLFSLLIRDSSSSFRRIYRLWKKPMES